LSPTLVVLSIKLMQLEQDVLYSIWHHSDWEKKILWFTKVQPQNC